MTKIFVTIVSVLFILHTAFGQGTLTPPGAPAPTMKTLAQIEPRAPISSAPYAITNPGSYYLVTNVVGVAGTNGITIAADNVTVDLNGFAVVGVASSLSGIAITGSHTNIAVRNGSLSAWGNNAILSPSTARNVALDHLIVSSGSISFDAIFVYNGMVSDCTIDGGYNGIGAVNSYIHHCLVSDGANAGISANDSSVFDCQIQNCSIYGIYINLPGCLIVGNMLRGNNSSSNSAGAGIYVNNSDNRIENNHVTANGVFGIFVHNVYSNNVVIKNTVSGNGGNNYAGTANNDFGPIGTAATATSPWANISH